MLKKMRKTLRFLQQSETDVGEIVAYIEQDNPEAAQRFREAFQETGNLLLVMSHIGSMRVSDTLVLQDVRVVPVRGFEKYFIFYRPEDDCVEIVRVLHGARDYPSFFRE